MILHPIYLFFYEDVMARTKKIINEENLVQEKPETQVIIAPMIDSRSVVMNTEASFVEPEKKIFEISNSSESNSKKNILVFEDGILLEELEEDSEKIDEFLSYNKKQLEENITLLNLPVTDADTLIYFHEGVQPRKYATFESYYAQNGLAPKTRIFNTWMEYYKKKFHLSTEEEIAIKVKGNLKYSFTLKINEEDSKD